MVVFQIMCVPTFSRILLRSRGAESAMRNPRGKEGERPLPPRISFGFALVGIDL